MKKYLKTVIVVSIMALLCVGYFFYLSNRRETKDSTDKSVDNQELAALTTKDIEKEYPESPKEVVKLYARITKAYYKTELTAEQIEALGTRARLLFDDELKGTQPDEECMEALKADIADYRSAGRYVSDFAIDGSQAVKYTTLEDKQYASLIVLYNVREGSKLYNSYTRFVLRKDDAGRWKILYWELVNDGSDE